MKEESKLEALRMLLREVKGWKKDALRGKMKKDPDADIETAEEDLEDGQNEDTGEEGGPIEAILKKMRESGR